MDETARLELLRSHPLFARLTEARRRALAAMLAPVSVEDGAAFMEEGAPSDGLYVVASGRVRVTKRLGDGGEKDLAVLGPGDCLGEMELLGGGTRSAGARAVGRAELLKLGAADLRAWLDADPSAAAAFYASLAEVQSARLRRTSDEVALLYDLSRLLLTPLATTRELLDSALDRVVPHLQGGWSAEARVHNPFEAEMDPAARRGEALSADGPEPAPAASAPAESWTDERTLRLILSGPKGPLAQLRFRASGALSDSRRSEAERTLGAVSRLLTTALENVEFRTDEILRERLKNRSHGPSL